MKSRMTNQANRLIATVVGLPRYRKRWTLIGIDTVALPIVMHVALLLAGGKNAALDSAERLTLLASVLVSVPILARTGLYRTAVRYMGPRAGLSIGSGVLAAVAILLLLGAFGALGNTSSAALIIFGALTLVYIGASRLGWRWVLLADAIDVPRVIIYGAGQAGAELVSALLISRQHTPIAFVDDNPALWGSVIAGVPVYDSTQLPTLVADSRVKRLLLAMPALNQQRRREILQSVSSLGIHVQTMPSIADLLVGVSRIDDVQDVDVTALLGRDPVTPNQHLFEACIRAKTILITGAGGSIGSELCRQIVRLRPVRLLLLEISELALYNINRELQEIVAREHLQVDVVPLLGNAYQTFRVKEILQTFNVQTVYHAAAYKHLPIVEQNIIEGIQNNVLSTLHTAQAALECRIETFVLISTDKAVNPSNVMGATKRFAEVVLQGMQQRTTHTRFCMVRFGNVLESSGSVVPLFREQIRRGGPVTVTHPDVTRYFMTIPEAAQLVIQAGSMAEGGDVFVLDMGKPIRIVDLATRMIELHGYRRHSTEEPHGEIKIEFTGLRPAEKLFEELLIGKNATGTQHPMILRAVEHALTWPDVESLLEELQIAIRRFDCRAATDILRRAVAEYQPPLGIHDIVWARRSSDAQASTTDTKIMDLQARRAHRSPPTGAPRRAE